MNFINRNKKSIFLIVIILIVVFIFSYICRSKSDELSFKTSTNSIKNKNILDEGNKNIIEAKFKNDSSNNNDIEELKNYKKDIKNYIKDEKKYLNNTNNEISINNETSNKNENSDNNKTSNTSNKNLKNESNTKIKDKNKNDKPSKNNVENKKGDKKGDKKDRPDSFEGMPIIGNKEEFYKFAYADSLDFNNIWDTSNIGYEKLELLNEYDRFFTTEAEADSYLHEMMKRENIEKLEKMGWDVYGWQDVWLPTTLKVKGLRCIRLKWKHTNEKW